MLRSSRSSRWISLTLLSAVTINSSSCGTILHPERRGMPHSGVLDPGIVLLDAAGLLLFLVPGIVAFAVDFSTGAIYLPASGCYYPAYSAAGGAAYPGTPTYSNRPAQASDFVTVRVPPDQMSREKIEQVVSEQTGQQVRLEPGAYKSARLEKLREFDDEAERLAGPDETAPATSVRLR